MAKQEPVVKPGRVTPQHRGVKLWEDIDPRDDGIPTRFLYGNTDPRKVKEVWLKGKVVRFKKIEKE